MIRIYLYFTWMGVVILDFFDGVISAKKNTHSYCSPRFVFDVWSFRFFFDFFSDIIHPWRFFFLLIYFLPGMLRSGRNPPQKRLKRFPLSKQIGGEVINYSFLSSSPLFLLELP